MAQKILTSFIDDIDGSDAEGTVKFGLDGTSYEIDLNAQHTQELRGALARFVEHGRRVGLSSAARDRRNARARLGTYPTTMNTNAARDWLRANPTVLNGRELKDRGRVPADLLAQVPNHVLYGGTPPANVITLPAPAATPATTPVASAADELAAGAADAGELAGLAAQHTKEPVSIEEATPAATTTKPAAKPKTTSDETTSKPATSRGRSRAKTS